MPLKYSNQDFLEEYEVLRSDAVSLINRFLDNHKTDSILDRSISYTLNSSGKLFRPVLTYAISEALGLPRANLKASPLGIELLHVSSLIHDDLPCIDDDDLRRGKPSLHKVFGEGTSLLVGDFLFSEAFNLIQKGIKPEYSYKIIEKASNSFSLLNKGQILDLTIRNESNLDKKNLLDQINEINLLKTSSLFDLSVSIPSIVANLSDSESKKLSSFANNLGLLFQVSDDILDYSEDNKKLKDKEINYISILSHGGTLKLADELFDISESEVRSLFPNKYEFLLGLVNMARYRKG